MNKRGSHVEIIISFIIFVTFILFIFSILEPSINLKADKKSFLEDIELGIKNQISAEMTTITVKITSSSQSCISLDEALTNLEIDSRIVALGKDGDSLNCYIASGDSDDLMIERGSTADNFIKIYSSDSFDSLESSSSSCQPLQITTNYQLGMTKTKEYYFETKMFDLLNEDYENLRSVLGIPESIEFGYGIKLANGTTFETEEGDLLTNIYVKETPIEYIDSEGNMLLGFLRIKTW